MPGSGSSPGEGNGNSLQYSCLENLMDRGTWSRLPFPSPGDLPDPGVEPRSPALLADALLSEPPGKFIDLEEPKTRRG